MFKILIVDDESYEREILDDIVSSRFIHGVQTRQAINGRQAVDIADLWAADIVLMDIELPGMNGIESTRRILAHRPDCKVIFVTAYSIFEYAQEAVKLGVNDYILKPVQADDVERAIRRAMAQAESYRQLLVMTPEAATLEAENNDKAAILIGIVTRYLQHNYMLCDISLDTVSHILNINASYLSSIFKRCVGVNFVDYLTSLRINAAKKLLADPLRSNTEVATSVGYESPNYFARAFKKNTGLTPTEYRRAYCKCGKESS